MDGPCPSPSYPPICIGGSGLSLKLLPLPSTKAGSKASDPQLSFSQIVPGNSPLTKERGGEERQTKVLEGDWVQLIWHSPCPLGGPNCFKDPDIRGS